MGLDNHRLLIYNGGGTLTDSRTLADWGIDTCVVTLRDGGDDEMQLTLRRGIDALPLFGYGGYASLTDPGGMQRFVGWMLRPGPRATGKSETHTYRFRGPRWKLERVIYKQDAIFYSNPYDWFSARVTLKSGRVILNRKLVGFTGVNVGLRDQLTEALDYAIASGTAPLAYEAGDLPNIALPMDEQVDKSCADVMDLQMRWCPAFHSYWSYPTLGALATLIFKADSGSAILPIALLEDFEPEARYDLLANTVRINYIASTVVAQSGDVDAALRAQFGLITDESVFTNGSDTVIETTVMLRPPHFDGNDLTDPEITPVLGLAAQLHAGFKTLFYDVSFSTRGGEVDWNYHPGTRFSFTGGDPAFQTANSVCRVITRDIGAGTTGYECGSPKHLGLDDLKALVWPNRHRAISRHASAMASGKGDQKPKDQDVKIPPPPAVGTWVLGSINGVLTWFEKTTCA